jgi:dephospho-CoA kinase
MYSIGLTGNIASGKSTVAKLFANKGIDIISADQISRDLTHPGQPAFTEIIKHFGESILDNNSQLNRSNLRKIIFTDINQRIWLENLLHPLIRQQIKKEKDCCKSAYCIIEIPLLPNKKDYPYLDCLLFVQASYEYQIKRLMHRDNCSREEALIIINIQANTEQHKIVADKILYNNSSMKELEEKVNLLHEFFVKKAEKSNN